MFWQESGQVFEELFCVYRGESLMTDKETRRRGGGCECFGKENRKSWEVIQRVVDGLVDETVCIGKGEI